MNHTHRNHPIAVRALLAAGLVCLAALDLTGCTNPVDSGAPGEGDPRLTARPGAPVEQVAPGEQTLRFGPSRRALLYVPSNYDPEVPHPFMVLLHGATGSAEDMRAFEPLADERGLILLIPQSREYTWDVINGPYGPDVQLIDQAMARAFELCNVDPNRVGLGGFSDGASYALSLGLPNGDLFTDLIAWSAGFILTNDPAVGRPDVFVSHGTGDEILPISRVRELIVPFLQSRGYDLLYREFDGGHVIPLELAEEALDRLVN